MFLFPLCSSFNVDSPHQQQKIMFLPGHWGGIPKSSGCHSLPFTSWISLFVSNYINYTGLFFLTTKTLAFPAEFSNSLLPACFWSWTKLKIIYEKHALPVPFPLRVNFLGFYLCFSSFVLSNSSSFPIFVTLFLRRTVSIGATLWNHKEICW